MRKEDYDRAGLLLSQIDKCNELKTKLSEKYHDPKSDNDLKELLSQVNEAMSVLRDKYQFQFDDL